MNRILLEHYHLPAPLEEQVPTFVEHYDYNRAQELPGFELVAEEGFEPPTRGL